jgi:hypothetical protein
MIARPAQTNPPSGTEATDQAASIGVDAQVPVSAQVDAVAALRKAAEVVNQITLETVREKQPGDGWPPINSGYPARQSSDTAAAVGAPAAGSGPMRLKLETAQELRAQSRLDEAEALYLSLLAEQPKLVRALAGLGHIARARGEPRWALKYYQAALEADPTRADLKLKLAAQLRKLARFREAEEIYRTVLAERLGRLPKPRRSRLPPFEISWLERETFARAAEWGRNLETLGGPPFELNLLVLAQDLAHGAVEEVKRDCILLRLDQKTKLLPLVSDREAYERVVAREAAGLKAGDLLGPVLVPRQGALKNKVTITRSHHEFVWRRETVSEMIGSSLQGHRRNIRKLLKAGVHVEAIGPENLDCVLACNDRWYAAMRAKGKATYYRARTIWTLENLTALEPLGVRHLAVMLDDDVIGYSVGCHLGASWIAFVHAKSDKEYDVGSLLAHERAKLYPDRDWINAADAGTLPGLAAFKERFTTGAEDKQLMSGWIKA